VAAHWPQEQRHSSDPTPRQSVRTGLPGGGLRHPAQRLAGPDRAYASASNVAWMLPLVDDLCWQPLRCQRRQQRLLIGQIRVARPSQMTDGLYIAGGAKQIIQMGHVAAQSHRGPKGP
jgi:hypothetical protein